MLPKNIEGFVWASFLEVVNMELDNENGILDVEAETRDKQNISLRFLGKLATSLSNKLVRRMEIHCVGELHDQRIVVKEIILGARPY
jgi:hypothetical protein